MQQQQLAKDGLVALFREFKYKEAEPLLVEVMEGQKKAYGPDDSENNAIKNALKEGEAKKEQLVEQNMKGFRLFQAGKFEEAEKELRPCLEERRLILGNNDPLTLTSIANLGHANLRLGRFSDAVTLLMEARAAHRKTASLIAPDSAVEDVTEAEDNVTEALMQMELSAMVLLASGCEDEAVGRLQDCLRFTRENGDDSTKRAVLLATLLDSLGRSDEARALSPAAEPASGSDPEAEAVDDPKTQQLKRLWDHVNFAGCFLFKNHKNDEAEGVLIAAMAKRRELYGDNSPEHIVSADNVAKNFLALHKYSEAQAAFEDVLERTRTVHGPDHEDTLSALLATALPHSSRGHFDAAISILQDCLERRRRVLGDNHPETLLAQNNLCWAFYSCNRYDALSLYPLALPLTQDLLHRMRESGNPSVNDVAMLLMLVQEKAKLEGGAANVVGASAMSIGTGIARLIGYPLMPLLPSTYLGPEGCPFLGPQVRTKEGLVATADFLKGVKRLGLYFGAHWW